MGSGDALQVGVIEQVSGGGQLGKDDEVRGQLAGPGDRRFQRFATGTVVRGVDPQLGDGDSHLVTGPMSGAGGSAGGGPNGSRRARPSVSTSAQVRLSKTSASSRTDRPVAGESISRRVPLRVWTRPHDDGGELVGDHEFGLLGSGVVRGAVHDSEDHAQQRCVENQVVEHGEA